MPFIETRDETSLYLKEWGAGRPVVLMHGWPLSASSWDDQAMAIADAGFRAIAYDRRGFGRSDQPWSGYDYDTLADDLADVMEATGATGRDDRRLLDGRRRSGALHVAPWRQGRRQTALISSVVPYMLKTADNPDGVAAGDLRPDDGRHEGGPRAFLRRLLQGLLRRRAARDSR